MDIQHPKVFISHSSEDKERFVTEFARRLRANGIDAWVDEWEMQPGDSLVDKIFNEGIGEAQALIVVLSNDSVSSEWVREEINAGFVRRVSKQTRLIPVIIDKECEIPLALQSTLYQKIEDVQSYDLEFERIVAAIYGVPQKPELGQAPAYVSSGNPVIPGLNYIDNAVLKLACEHAIREGDFTGSAADIWTDAEALGMPEEEMHDSIRILHERGLFEGQLENRPTIEHFTITLLGFHEYAKAYIPNIDEILTSVAARIYNDKMMNSTDIQRAVGQPALIIQYALDLFTNQGWIDSGGTLDGVIHIGYVSPQLKRQLLD